MKAGGIDIVASYVFWNHHEATEGRYDWSGRRDLRRFVDLAHAAGLLFHLRPGPWVHAEARNGGLPHWLQAQGDAGTIALRSNDERYLAHVQRFFAAIGAQLQGRLWSGRRPAGGRADRERIRRPWPGPRGRAHRRTQAHRAGQRPARAALDRHRLAHAGHVPPHDVLPVSGAYPDGFWGGLHRAAAAVGRVRVQHRPQHR